MAWSPIRRRHGVGKASHSWDDALLAGCYVCDGNMRYWGPNIHITGRYDWGRTGDITRDANPDQYEVETQDVLRNISRIPSGRAFLDTFNSSMLSKRVIVMPVAPDAIGQTHADAVNATMATAPRSIFNTPLDPQQGTGSDVILTFRASLFATPVRGHLFPPQDSLFHELVHAARQLRGRWWPSPMFVWDTVEELYATTLTNIFASSDHRNSDMRGNHSSVFAPMTMTDVEFYNAHSGDIQSLRTSTPDLFNSMSGILDCWNPLRVANENYASWFAEQQRPSNW